MLKKQRKWKEECYQREKTNKNPGCSGDSRVPHLPWQQEDDRGQQLPEEVWQGSPKELHPPPRPGQARPGRSLWGTSRLETLGQVPTLPPGTAVLPRQTSFCSLSNDWARRSGVLTAVQLRTDARSPGEGLTATRSWVLAGGALQPPQVHTQD